MNELIENIFTKSEIELVTFEGVNYFNYIDVSYYFTLEVDEEDLKTIKSFEDLESNKDYKLFKEKFNAVEKFGGSNTITKNSSLLFIVKVDNMNQVDNLQQQILLIEEDEYFFKKYVLLYSEQAIVNLDKENVFEDIYTKVVNKEKFNFYSQNGYSDDLEEYIFILQLFIKLPFLKLIFSSGDYETLECKISNLLGEKDDKIYGEVLTPEIIQSIDFLSEEADREIDNLISKLEND